MLEIIVYIVITEKLVFCLKITFTKCVSYFFCILFGPFISRTYIIMQTLLFSTEYEKYRMEIC
jgi:hypothetical protein